MNEYEAMDAVYPPYTAPNKEPQVITGKLTPTKKTSPGILATPLKRAP